MASIVDKPKESSQGDLLEIEKYTNGLIKFIESSATPITIGVQGEWGSGKTSLLNTIKEDLCDKSSAKHFPIWINTWEYSLLSSPDETLIKIVTGLVNEVGDLTASKNSEAGKKAIGVAGSILKGFGKVVGGVGGKSVEMLGGVMESAVNKQQDNSIKALRDALQTVINEAIKASDKKAFIFFIDDLDRLDPAVAVSILELIKNLFDLKNCIFVLAIDYGVVVKGLQSKFGKMTEENEWEFRAFFDKIIQLPFSMPISSYNISKYLQSLLVDVHYFEKSDLKDEQALEKISEIVSLSVGTNPRTLKRLANSVSLIEIIRGDQTITSQERFIEFALICIQIAYPLIYSLIQKESDFTSWDDRFVMSVLKNKKINEADLDALKETEEFDEEWEQNLWKICQISTFLKQKSYQLSKLLNFIKDNVPDVKDEEMGETLDRLLSMSSVTSVSAEGVNMGKKEKYQKIKFDGWDSYVETLNEKNIQKNVIENLKIFLDALGELYQDKIIIKYTPTLISVIYKDKSDKKHSVMAILVRKKFLIVEFWRTEQELLEKYPQYNFKRGMIFFRLDEENNFEYREHIPLITDRLNILDALK